MPWPLPKKPEKAQRAKKRPQFLALLAFPGSFAHKEKPGKRGKYSLGFPSFSRAQPLLAFPGFFLVFLHVQKNLDRQEFYAGIPVNSRRSFTGE